MLILNLGCGNKVSHDSRVLNLDMSAYLQIKQNLILKTILPVFLDTERKEKFRQLPSNLKFYDMRKGLPFPDNSIDIVYHSHVLEHFDFENAPTFLKECRRVLKKETGVIRIVVPDLKLLCENYLSSFKLCQSSHSHLNQHNHYVAEMIEQCVRKESYGTKTKKPLRRWIENKLLGDARKRGETHQWMYDYFNLSDLLSKVNFRNIEQKTFNTSKCEYWNDFGLDFDENQCEYKPGSLYIEANN